MLLPKKISNETRFMANWMSELQDLRQLAQEAYNAVSNQRDQARSEAQWYHPQPNDLVWLYQPLVISKSSKSRSRKLHNPWTGPWIVAQLDPNNDNVELHDEIDPTLRRTVHLSRVKPFQGVRRPPSKDTLPDDLRLHLLDDEEESDVRLPLPNTVPAPVPEAPASNPAPASVNAEGIDPELVSTHETTLADTSNSAPVQTDSYTKPPPVENDLFEVESIVGHVIKQGRYHYVVRWKGYPPEYDLTFPASHLRHASRLLSQYKRAHGILSDIVKRDQELRTHDTALTVGTQQP